MHPYEYSVSQIVDTIDINNVSTVNAENIAGNSVGVLQLQNESIQNDAFAIGAVTSEKIEDRTIQNEDVSDGTIESDVILNGSILNEDINTAKLDFDKLNITNADITGIGVRNYMNLKLKLIYQMA